MEHVNILAIYKIMILFYKSHRFEVSSTINKKTFKPHEMTINFNVDNLPKVINVKRLHYQFEKHITSVKQFFITVEENKIILVIEFNKCDRIFEPEIEFSLN